MPARLLDYDKTNKDGSLSGDPLGSVETTLDEVTKAGHHGLSLTLFGAGAKPGSLLHVMWEAANPACRGSVTLTLTGTGLANRDGWMGKSDPFWQLSKRRPDGEYVRVAKSEKVMNNLNPTFKPVTIDLQRLCNGNMSRDLKVRLRA